MLRSDGEENGYYVGLTSNVRARLASHNGGHCPHTAKRGSWQLHVVIGFSDEPTARQFERYLKSGSGRSLRSDTSSRSFRKGGNFNDGHRVPAPVRLAGSLLTAAVLIPASVIGIIELGAPFRCLGVLGRLPARSDAVTGLTAVHQLAVVCYVLAPFLLFRARTVSAVQ